MIKEPLEISFIKYIQHNMNLPMALTLESMSKWDRKNILLTILYCHGGVIEPIKQ